MPTLSRQSKAALKLADQPASLAHAAAGAYPSGLSQALHGAIKVKPR
jgi:hypothetical protein